MAPTRTRRFAAELNARFHQRPLALEMQRGGSATIRSRPLPLGAVPTLGAGAASERSDKMCGQRFRYVSAPASEHTDPCCRHRFIAISVGTETSSDVITGSDLLKV
ncbi:hypothetical protein MRX96_047104 [Rhipicephalus microplus]